MEPLLDALRTGDIPVQKLGLALQGWLYRSKRQLNAVDPDHMQHLLLHEDTTTFFLHAYGIEYTKWEPDYKELEAENADPEEDSDIDGDD